MRCQFYAVILSILLITIPFALAANVTNDSQTVILEQTPNGTNATTDFDEFLEKEYGVYYQVLDDNNSNKTTTSTTNTEFTNESSVVVINDNISDFGGIYVSIDDALSTNESSQKQQQAKVGDVIGTAVDGDVQISFGEISQQPLVDGQNVKWVQQIILTNSGEAKEVALNLWSHDDIYNRSFLWDILKIEMRIGQNQISQTPIGLIPIKAGEEVIVTVSVETPSVTIEKSCYDITLADLIPEDAVIIESTADLDLVIESVCSGKITYDSTSRYRDVLFI